MSQTTLQPGAPGRVPNGPAGTAPVVYANGELSIDASNTNLGQLLQTIASLAGIAVDMPPSANAEQIPRITLGPGPARSVLASLLSDSGFNYLIQASDTNSDAVSQVVLITKEVILARGSEPASKTAPASVVTAEPDAAKPADAALADSAATEPPPSSKPRTMPGGPVTNARSTLTPPASLDSQSINNQLQQMYQQRQVLTQQNHQFVPGIPQQ